MSLTEQNPGQPVIEFMVLHLRKPSWTGEAGSVCRTGVYDSRVINYLCA
jgi:hypothetical protein